MAKFSIVSKKTSATLALEKLLRETEKRKKEKLPYDPSKQAEGIKERLEGSGLDTKKFTDKRNIVEKFFNVTPDQNFLFDVFEVIGRPQQVLFNAIDASQKGEDVGKAMLAGLRGDNEVYFKEILNNAGITEDSGDTFGVDDVLGFVGDVFLDPVDLALIAAAPFTGGASAAILFVDKSLDAYKANKARLALLEAGLDALEAGSKAFKRHARSIKTLKKTIKKFEPLVEKFETLKTAAKKVTELGKDASKFDVKQAKRAYEKALHPLKVRKSALDMAFRSSKWGIKTGVKFVDNNVTKLLQKMDARAIGELGGPEMAKAAGYLKRVESYKDFKSQVQAIFEVGKNLPKEMVRKVLGKSEALTEEMLIIQSVVNQNIEKFRVRLNDITGREHTVKEASQIIQDMIEYKLKPKGTFREMLAKPSTARLDQAMADELADTMFRYLPDQFASKQEAMDFLFEARTTADGTVFYTMKGDNVSSIREDVEKVMRSQDEAYAPVREQIEEVMRKKQEALDFYHSRDTDLVIETVDGKPTLTRTGATNDTMNQANRILDEDIIQDNLGESKLFDSNEDIRRAAEQQTTRLRQQRQSLKRQLADASPEQAAALREQIAAIDRKIQEVGQLKSKVSRARREAAKKLDPLLNPDDYSIEKLQDPFKGQFLDIDLAYERDLPRFYSAQERQLLDSRWADEGLAGIANEADANLRKMYDKIDEAMGTNFAYRAEDGYIRHSITPEAKALNALKDTGREFDVELAGRTSSFAYREWRMSALEANKLSNSMLETRLLDPSLTDKQKEIIQKVKDKGLFERELSKSMNDFIVEAKDISKLSSLYDELILEGTFENNDLFTPATEGKRKFGKTKITKTKLIEKLEKMKLYRKDSTAIDNFITSLKNKKGEAFYIDSALSDLIGVAGNKEASSFFLQMVEGLNNIFKQLSLLTPGFHMRNAIGNYTNLYLSGVNMPLFNTYLGGTLETLNKGSDIFKRATVNGFDSLTAAEKLIYNDYRMYLESGFHDIAYELFDLPDLMKKKLTGSAKKDSLYRSFLKKNMDANKYVDNMYRMTLLKYAKDNPDVYTKLGIDSADEFVRYVLFDPNDLSQFEKKYIRNMVPFYTFMKKNLVFQMQNIMDNPTKYNKVFKSVEAAWTAQNIDQDEIEAYKKENFWIPIYKKKDGDYVAIKANLPVGDLGEFLGDPIRKILASTTPAIRAPFEAVTNTQVYTGLPIQQFQGQKGFRLPFLDRKTEYIVSQLGVANPASVISSLVNPFIRKEVAADDITGALSLTSTGNVAREQKNRAFQELESLRQATMYYKQQGAEIKSLEEIRAQVSLNKTTTAQILARLQATLK